MLGGRGNISPTLWGLRSKYSLPPWGRVGVGAGKLSTLEPRSSDVGQIWRLGSIGIAAIALTSCFSPSGPAAQGSPSATPRGGLTSPAPSNAASQSPGLPSPAPSISTTYASAVEASVGAAQPLAARRHQTYVAANACPSSNSCIHGPAQEHDGAGAAYFVYRSTGATAAGPGPYDCFVYVFQDPSGWPQLDGYCPAQVSASVGGTNYIETPGSCANVRENPGLSARVIKCLAWHTRITIDAGPTWTDGHMWWRLTGQGWTAHDNIFPSFAATSLTCTPTPCWVSEAP